MCIDFLPSYECFERKKQQTNKHPTPKTQERNKQTKKTQPKPKHWKLTLLLIDQILNLRPKLVESK